MCLDNVRCTLRYDEYFLIDSCSTSEVATSQLRERTISIATSLSFVAVLLVSYINPFVQNAPGNLQSRVGFIYGSFSLIAVVWAYFFMPELSGRSLEELDE